MDETYSKVKGEWMYLYKGVDKEGNTIDFLLAKRSNKSSAHQFLAKATSNNVCLKVVNIDQRGSNEASIRTYNKRSINKVKISQFKYLSNRIEERLIGKCRIWIKQSLFRTMLKVAISPNFVQRNSPFSF